MDRVKGIGMGMAVAAAVAGWGTETCRAAIPGGEAMVTRGCTDRAESSGSGLASLGNNGGMGQ
jgi:hypothetical protein